MAKIILKNSGTPAEVPTSLSAGELAINYEDEVLHWLDAASVIRETTLNPAGLDSPDFTGTPTAPTAAGADSSTQIATTAYVQGELSAKEDALGFTPPPEGRAVATSGLATGGGDLTADRTIDVPAAVAADFRTGTDDTKALTSDAIWDAAALVSLTQAATIAVDLATGLNFTTTMTGNRTLGNPTNSKPGQCGTIEIKQDATGSRTLAYSSSWDFAGGTAPTLSTAANSIDFLDYFVVDSTNIRASLSKAWA